MSFGISSAFSKGPGSAFSQGLVQVRVRFIKCTVKDDMRTYDNMGKITTGPGDDYTLVCLLGYLHLKKIITFK